MKYVILKPQNREERILFDKIDSRAAVLFERIASLNLSKIGLSPYNQRYLNDYIQNYTFYIRFYTQVLIAGLRGLPKPPEKSVFIDYGGGSGLFSLLAKQTGFKTVVYNDIYDVSVADAKILSKKTGIQIDYFIGGDIDTLAGETGDLGISADLICSFEVLEHIYNLDDWFRKAIGIRGSYTLVFSSSANSGNPYIVRRLKKIQRRAELAGTEKVWGNKERDTTRPFLEIRKEIIADLCPGVGQEQLKRLAVLTRGYNREDIEKKIIQFRNTGEEPVPVQHPTNTCDPFTGNWSEHLIDFKMLIQSLMINGFEKAVIFPGLYTYSGNKFVYAVKKILNLTIRLSGRAGLLFSPVFILKAYKIEKP